MFKLIFLKNVLLFASLLIEIEASFFFDYGGTDVSNFGSDRAADDRKGFGQVMEDPSFHHISNDRNFDSEVVFNPKGGRRRSRPGGQRLKYNQHFKDNPDSSLKRESLDDFAARRKKEMEEHPERFIQKKRRRRRKQKKDEKQSEEIDDDEPTVKPTTEKAKTRFNTKLSEWYWKNKDDYFP